MTENLSARRRRRPQVTAATANLQLSPSTEADPAVSTWRKRLPFIISGACLALFFLFLFWPSITYNTHVATHTFSVDGITGEKQLDGQMVAAFPNFAAQERIVEAWEGQGWNFIFQVVNDPEKNFQTTTFITKLDEWKKSDTLLADEPVRRANVEKAAKAFEENLKEIERMRYREVPVAVAGDISSGFQNNDAVRTADLIERKTNLRHLLLKGHGMKYIPCLIGGSVIPDCQAGFVEAITGAPRSGEEVDVIMARLREKILATFTNKGPTAETALAKSVNSMLTSNPAKGGIFLFLSDYFEHFEQWDFEKNIAQSANENYSKLDASLFPNGMPDLSTTSVVLALRPSLDSKKSADAQRAMMYFKHAFTALAKAKTESFEAVTY